MNKEQMLNELREACENSLREVYPAGVPEEVSQRLERELSRAAEHADCADGFLLYRELSDAAKRSACDLFLAGTMYDSIITYLLGKHELNPMPAHYYCPQCGYYHEEPQTTAGLDLPDKHCPACGGRLRRDGFSLDERFCWDESESLGFEYRIPSRFRRVAYRVIERHYTAQERETLLFKPHYLEDDPDGIEKFSVAVLPRGEKIDNRQELRALLRCGHWDMEGVETILLNSMELLERLDTARWSSGLLDDELSAEELTDVRWYDLVEEEVLSREERGILAGMTRDYGRNVSFGDLARCLSGLHCTYEDENFLETAQKAGIPWRAACSRNDVYELLLGAGMESGRAFRNAEMIRKGKWHADPECIDTEAPKEAQRLGHLTYYLFPRSFGQWFALQYLRIAKCRMAGRPAKLF